MKLRKSNLDDVQNLSNLAKDAKQFMKSNGLTQWGDNYPNSNTFIEQAKNGVGYCIVNDCNKIIGYFALIFGIEKNYLKTYEGKFKFDNPYGTIHTVIIDNDYRGKNFSKYIFSYADDLALKNNIEYLRIDTHKDNIPMKKSIIANGFSYSAIIKVEDHTDRLAFEKKVDKNGL